MVVPLLIIAGDLNTCHLADLLLCQRASIHQHGCRLLQEIQRDARISRGVGGNERESLRFCRIAMNRQPILFIIERAMKHRDDRFISEPLQMDQPQTGEQRPVDLKIGILRRRTDEDECPILHIGQKHILLSLIETVDFIDENDRPPLVVRELFFRFGNDIPDLFDPARGRIHLDEAALCHFRNDRCDRRLPTSRRAKKKEGWDRIPLYHAIKERLPSNGSILSDDVFKPPGAHAIRQGGIPLPRLRGHVE